MEVGWEVVWRLWGGGMEVGWEVVWRLVGRWYGGWLGGGIQMFQHSPVAASHWVCGDTPTTSSLLSPNKWLGGNCRFCPTTICWFLGVRRVSS